MSEQHGPAHRGGHCGIAGTDYVYITPREEAKAARDARTVEELDHLHTVAEWAEDGRAFCRHCGFTDPCPTREILDRP